MADNEKKGAGPKLLALAVVVGAVIWLGLRWSAEREERQTEEAAEDFLAANGPIEITYKVGGSTTWADVTMETPDGTEQISPDVPMTNRDTGRTGLTMTFSPGDFVYISAQNNESMGTVSCAIVASDGSVISSNESDGAFAIATCDGRAR